MIWPISPKMSRKILLYFPTVAAIWIFIHIMLLPHAEGFWEKQARNLSQKCNKEDSGALFASRFELVSVYFFAIKNKIENGSVFKSIVKISHRVVL